MAYFSWLDQNASDEAKSALARTMVLKDVEKKQVASALVEVFDRIYTYPLLRWTPLFRSLLFTFVMTTIFVFEMRDSDLFEGGSDLARVFVAIFLTNATSDYLSLFLVRPWLVRCGTKPIFALLSGTFLAGFVVYLGMAIRAGISIYLLPLTAIDIQEIQQHAEVFGFTPDVIEAIQKNGYPADQVLAGAAYLLGLVIFTAMAALPAMAVFVWLPLFAVGILVVRLLSPLSWVVTKAQWALNEGNKHPLKAVGCVAAVAVFVVAAGWQTSASHRTEDSPRIQTD